MDPAEIRGHIPWEIQLRVWKSKLLSRARFQLPAGFCSRANELRILPRDREGLVPPKRHLGGRPCKAAALWLGVQGSGVGVLWEGRRGDASIFRFGEQLQAE